MCLANPQKIIKINKDKALTDSNKEINISLVSKLKKGDYVLAQNGFAVKKISQKEAKASLKIFKGGKK
ncbi:MAG: HypC/HybG/HupF family hydrogenase formation chaperone [Patescibacteria group bacterium]|nr:HypC/HybG/HupF family hydrogenase formation chaperone [Patescibacteria group bacterium]